VSRLRRLYPSPKIQIPQSRYILASNLVMKRDDFYVEFHSRLIKGMLLHFWAQLNSASRECLIPGLEVRIVHTGGPKWYTFLLLNLAGAGLVPFLVGASGISTFPGYGLYDQRVGVRVPVGSRIFASPSRPDRLWGAPSLFIQWGTGGRFPGGKAAGA
jgi:hypothetical protein